MKNATRDRISLVTAIGMAIVLSGCARAVGVRYGVNLERPGAAIDYATLGFQSGDRFRLLLQPEQDCYVYLLHQGSNGEWSMLFPLAEVQRGENFLREDCWVEIPSEGWYRLDAQPGMERMYVLACRKAIGEAEQMRNLTTLSNEDVAALFAAVDDIYNLHLLKEVRQIHLTHIRHKVKGLDEFPVLRFGIDMLHE